MAAADSEDSNLMRFRLAVFGQKAVGKSAILQRFLNDEYTDNYRETVPDDLHSKCFEVNGTLLQVDFVDSAGKVSCPAMRRICILNGQAFLLVYSITDPESFTKVSDICEQIKEVRTDFRSVPIVVAGNKADMADQRSVFPQQVDQWLYLASADFNLIHMEVSAKTGYHVRDVFEAFVRMSRLLEVQAASARPRQTGRRLSLQPTWSLPGVSSGRKSLRVSSENRPKLLPWESMGTPPDPTNRKVSAPVPFRSPKPTRKSSDRQSPVRSRSRVRSQQQDYQTTECFVQ